MIGQLLKKGVFMSGVKKQIDKLGRVVIPISYRKFLNLSENSYLNIELQNNSIIITSFESNCVLCGATTDLHSEKPLCAKCIKSIKELN